MNDLIKRKLDILPGSAWLLFDEGSARNHYLCRKSKGAKNRVRSYFTGTHEGKTQRLVSEIEDFDYIVTSSNIEALILELNLIKLHDPKYNVMLTDDKTYPYLKITNEKHPRLITTRKVKKDKAKYFGPYPNAYAASETKKLLIAYIRFENVYNYLQRFVYTITWANVWHLV